MSESRFVELQEELFSLFAKGNMNDALSFIHNIKIEFPERLDKILFWEACVYSNQRKNEEAVAILEEGLKKGIWWNPAILTTDPDLQNVQTDKEFKKIVETCGKIFSSQKKNATPELFVYGDSQSDIILLALHARGTNVKDFAPYWLNDKGEDPYLLGLPQSSQIFGYNTYCWDDQETAIKEIEEAYKELKETFHTKSVIMGGASQGGKLSIEFCLRKRSQEITGFIAVMPAIKDVAAIEALLKENEHSSLKGIIIIGDQDPFYKNSIELVQLLQANHIDCKLIVNEGLGHFFPQNFPELLSEAFRYILR